MGSRTWILLAVAFTLLVHVSECQENAARSRSQRRRIQVARRRLTTEAPTAHHLAVAEEQKRNELALQLHNQAIAEEAIRRELALLKHNEEIAKEQQRRDKEQLRRAEAAEGFAANEKVRRDHVLKQDLENRKTHDQLIQQEQETRNRHDVLMQRLAEVRAKSPTKEFETLTLTKHDQLVAEELERKELALQAHNKEIAEEEIRQELAGLKHNQDIAEELIRKELALEKHNQEIAEEAIRKEELTLEKHNQLIAEEQQRREEEEIRRAEAATTFEASEKIRRDQIVKQDLENRKAHDLLIQQEAERLKQHDVLVQEELERRKQAQILVDEELERRKQQQILVDEELERRKQAQILVDEELKRREEHAILTQTHLEEESGRRDEQHVLVEEELERRNQEQILVEEELERRNQQEILLQEILLQDEMDSAISDITLTTKKPARRVEQRTQVQNGRVNLHVGAKSPTKEFETLALTKHDRLVAEELDIKELALQAHNKEIAEEEIRQELARQKYNQEIAEEAIRQELALEKHNQLIAEEQQRREEEELRRAEAATTFEASEKIRRDQIVKQDLENRKAHDLLIQQEAERRKQHDVLVQEELERRKQAQILVDEELERRKQQQILVDEELERRKQAQILVDEELKRREEHAILTQTQLEEESGRGDEQQVLVKEELERRNQQQILVEEELERRNQQEILLQDEMDSAISDITLTTKNPARRVEQRTQVQNGRVNGRIETRKSVSGIARKTTETISSNNNGELSRPTSRPVIRRRIVSRNRGGAQAPTANRKREVDIASFSEDYVRHKRNKGTVILPTSELERQQQNFDKKLALELHQADIGEKHQNDGLGLHETQANEHLRITLEREIQIQQQEKDRIRLEEERLKLENPDRLNVQNEPGFKNSHQHNLNIKSANEKNQANVGVDHENAGLKLHAAQVNEHARVTEEREKHIQLQNQKQIEIEEERLKQESLRPSFLQNIPELADGKNISQAERHLLNLNEKKTIEEKQANFGVSHQNEALDLHKSQAHQHDLITQQREKHVRMQEEARIEAERIRLEKEEARILNASGLQRIARNIEGNNLPNPSSRVDRSSGNYIGGQFALISFAALMLKLFTY